MKIVYGILVLIALGSGRNLIFADEDPDPAPVANSGQESGSVMDDLLGLFATEPPRDAGVSEVFPKQVEANMLAILLAKSEESVPPPLIRGRYIHGDSDPDAVCKFVYGRNYGVERFEVSKYSEIIPLTFFQKYFQGKTLLRIYSAGERILVDRVREGKHAARVFKVLRCRKESDSDRKFIRMRSEVKHVDR